MRKATHYAGLAHLCSSKQPSASAALLSNLFPTRSILKKDKNIPLLLFGSQHFHTRVHPDQVFPAWPIFGSKCAGTGPSIVKLFGWHMVPQGQLGLFLSHSHRNGAALRHNDRLSPPTPSLLPTCAVAEYNRLPLQL